MFDDIETKILKQIQIREKEFDVVLPIQESAIYDVESDFGLISGFYMFWYKGDHTYAIEIEIEPITKYEGQCFVDYMYDKYDMNKRFVIEENTVENRDGSTEKVIVLDQNTKEDWSS